MSADDVRKKIEGFRKEAQERKEEEEKKYQSLPTIQEWDSAVVDFAKRIFRELFPESWSGPEIINRMKYSEGDWVAGIGGMPPHYDWWFYKNNIGLMFNVLLEPGRNEKNPRMARGELRTCDSQACAGYYFGIRFSSPAELESGFDDIFEYLYLKK